MSIENILSAIDAEIARMEKARELLVSMEKAKATITKPTFRKGRGNRPPLSLEARAKIAAAQKKRWAKQKKAA